MSDRLSDAELIRICLEGSTDDLTDNVVSQISERLHQSALLKAAVGESPIAEEITSRISTVTGVENVQISASQSKVSGSAKVVSAVTCAGVIIGLGLWLANSNEDKPVPEIANPDSAFARSADEESDAQNSETGGPEKNSLAVAAIEKEAESPAGDDHSPESSPATPPVTDAVSSKTAEADVPEEATPDAPPAVTVESTKPKQSESESGEPPVWAESLSMETPPRSFDEVAWLMPGEEQPDQYPPQEFQQWFERLPGKPFQVSEQKVSSRIFTGFSGIARLRAPWVDAAVLRIGIYDTERCSFTVWHGNRGVQLRYYRSRNPHVWGASSVTRAGSSGEDALPRPGRFLTSDCGRWHRSNFGIFDLRWNDGYLRLVRGDVVLLAVPFAGPPDEVILDGKLKLRQVRMLRSEPLPETIIQQTVGSPKQNLLDDALPADLDWSLTDVPDGAFSRVTETKSIRLETKSDSDKQALSFVKVPDAGLSEVIFRLGSADPGTGIYFGRPTGEQIFRISCVWDTGANKPALWFQSAGQHEVERRFDPDTYVVPWTGRNQWIRVVAGYGITTVQMSADGRHWGWIIDNPSRTDWERVGSIGLFTEPKGDRKIQLDHLSVSEFAALPSVADQKLISQVDVEQFGPLNSLDIGAWWQRTGRLQPDDVSYDDWRRACAIATLRARPRAPLGTFLLNGLLANGAFSNVSLDPTTHDIAWQLLDETSQLVSPLDYNRAVQFQYLYHELARQQVISNRENPQLASDVPDASDPPNSVTGRTAAALLNAPMQTHQASALTAQAAASLELIGLVQAGQFEEVRQLVDKIVFWNSTAHPSRDWWSQVDPLYPTVAWAELRSHAALDTESQSARLTMPRRWRTTLTPERHPLAQPVSKEAYNVMAEFQAAVSGGAFQDACQVIASSGSTELIGLLPDSQDDQLLVSFPNAVAMAMNRNPELRQQMNDRFGAVGLLRVRQAIRNGDFQQVEAATVQFFGTPAAAESDLWLGDRALAAGQFVQARSYFERSIAGFRRNSQVETAEIASAEARMKIVSALLGESPVESESKAEATDVTIHGQQLSAQQLAGLVGELAEAGKQQNSENTVRVQMSEAPVSNFEFERVPLPVSHKIEKRGRYEGDLGEHVGRSVPADTDWVSRQLASTMDGDRAFLCNRFQLSCLDLTNGTTKWNQQLGGDHGSAHQWPMLAMRPLVAGDAVFCRRLTKKGTELVCCQASDGAIRWRQQLDQAFVSDPFLLRGRLQILSTDQSTVGPTVLNLLTVHREKGTILSSVPVLKLFDAWQNASLVCQVAVEDSRFFISTVGAIACCNFKGQTLWVRRREWTPVKLDTRYRYARSWSPPEIVENRLIVGQPESPVVDCLDLETGRLLWQHVEPELRRIISQHGGTLLLETRRGLTSISTESGQIEWEYSAANLLDGIAVGPMMVPSADQAKDAETEYERHILILRHEPYIEGRTSTAVPTLIWIHAGTGQEIARQRFISLADREARVGPLLITKDRFWAFSGKNRKDGKRDLIELVSDLKAPLSSPVDQDQLASWHPEFLEATFPDNHPGHPDLVAIKLQRDSRNGIDAISPGWLLMGPPQPGGMGKRPEHRGQKEVLELRLQPKRLTPEELQAFAGTPLNAIRLLRTVLVPDEGDQTFRFKAGLKQGESWNLTIDANGQQVHSTVINDETAPSGWMPIQTSLQRWSGQQVRILIACSLADVTKQSSVYLSELNSSTMSRQDASK